MKKISHTHSTTVIPRTFGIVLGGAAPVQYQT